MCHVNGCRLDDSDVIAGRHRDFSVFHRVQNSLEATVLETLFLFNCVCGKFVTSAFIVPDQSACNIMR